jgi:hypothetical protein
MTNNLEWAFSKSDGKPEFQGACLPPPVCKTRWKFRIFGTHVFSNKTHVICLMVCLLAAVISLAFAADGFANTVEWGNCPDDDTQLARLRFLRSEPESHARLRFPSHIVVVEDEKLQAVGLEYETKTVFCTYWDPNSATYKDMGRALVEMSAEFPGVSQIHTDRVCEFSLVYCVKMHKCNSELILTMLLFRLSSGFCKRWTLYHQ